MPTDTEDRTVLDDLTLIEKLDNQTPWRTEDLFSLLLPYIRDHDEILYGYNRDAFPVEGWTVETLRASPGVKREKQQLAKVSFNRHSKHGSRMVVSIISPKRAAARTDLLDRLSVTDDLKANETILPPKVFRRLKHALDNLKSMGDYSSPGNRYECPVGRCRNCDLDRIPFQIIRGDTKQKTKPAKPLKRLERELDWARSSMEAALEKAEKKRKEIERLEKRIAKRRAAGET